MFKINVEKNTKLGKLKNMCQYFFLISALMIIVELLFLLIDN